VDGYFHKGGIMTSILKSGVILLTALWVGGLFWIGFVFAPYLFTLAARHDPAVPNTSTAASLIGPLLYGADVVGLIVAVGLVGALLVLRRREVVPLGGKLFLSEIALAIAFGSACLNYWIVTPRVNAARDQLATAYGGFHLADRADPLYEQFTTLHQTSTVVFMVGFGAALLTLVCLSQLRARRSVGAAPA
jgi:hypothetical protein